MPKWKIEWTNLKQEQRGYISKFSIVCLTKTWLQEHIFDSSTSLHGLQTAWTDRNCKQNGNSKGEETAVLVDRWCSRICSPSLGM